SAAIRFNSAACARRASFFSGVIIFSLAPHLSARKPGPLLSLRALLRTRWFGRVAGRSDRDDHATPLRRHQMPPHSVLLAWRARSEVRPATREQLEQRVGGSRRTGRAFARAKIGRASCRERV